MSRKNRRVLTKMTSILLVVLLVFGIGTPAFAHSSPPSPSISFTLDKMQHISSPSADVILDLEIDFKDFTFAPEETRDYVIKVKNAAGEEIGNDAGHFESNGSKNHSLTFDTAASPLSAGNYTIIVSSGYAQTAYEDYEIVQREYVSESIDSTSVWVNYDLKPWTARNQLPSTITISDNEGKTYDQTITWQFDKKFFSSKSSGVSQSLTGTYEAPRGVENVPETVSGEVKVKYIPLKVTGNEDRDIRYGSGIWGLPNNVTIHLNKRGQWRYGAVIWDTKGINTSTLGEHTITGRILVKDETIDWSHFSKNVSTVRNVVKTDFHSLVSTVDDVTVDAGTKFPLREFPSSVTIRDAGNHWGQFKNNYQSDVNWSWEDKYNRSEPGVYSVTGEVEVPEFFNEFDQVLNRTVTVKPYIHSVVNPAGKGVTVYWGTDLSDISLPKSGDVLLYRGAKKFFGKKSVDLSSSDWGSKFYNSQKPGTYTVWNHFEMNQIIDHSEFTNYKRVPLLFSTKVTVLDPYVTGISKVDDLDEFIGTDESSVLSKLPEKTKVTVQGVDSFEDSEIYANLEWRSKRRSPYDENKTGTYTFVGTVTGYTDEKGDHVNVTKHPKRQYEKIEVDVTVKLPEVVEVDVFNILRDSYSFINGTSESVVNFALPYSIRLKDERGQRVNVNGLKWNIEDFNATPDERTEFRATATIDLAAYNLSYGKENTLVLDTKVIVGNPYIVDVLEYPYKLLPRNYTSFEVANGTLETDVPFPETVKVLDNRGVEHDVPVVWDFVRFPSYNPYREGSYYATGELLPPKTLDNGIAVSRKAYVKVDVKKPHIVDFDSDFRFTVDHLTSAKEIKGKKDFPRNIVVTDNRGDNKHSVVTWDFSTFDPSVPGEHTVSGSFSLPKGVIQSTPATELTTSMTIEVLDPYIVDVEVTQQKHVVDYGTRSDKVVSHLPTKGTITDSAGVDHEVVITWAHESYNRHQEGDQTFVGTFSLPKGVTLKSGDVLTDFYFETTVTIRQDLFEKHKHVTNEEIASIGTEKNLVVDLTNEDDVNEVRLSNEQVQQMKQLGLDLKVVKNDLEITVPLENFEDDLEDDIRLYVDRLAKDPVVLEKSNETSSSIYKFTLMKGETALNLFDYDIELVFLVDDIGDQDPNDLKLYYWNPTTEEWELIGGEYRDGMLYSSTGHFSIFGVFNQQLFAVPAEDDDTNEPTPTDGDTDQPVDEEKPGTIEPSEEEEVAPVTESPKKDSQLPSTATSYYNWILLGIFLILLGAAFAVRERFGKNRVLV
ncbi:hypothetical protein [Evansella tamaricis]|uniref:Uncharacterized protein n=1 Tax=Evansella tamaricis TaxID=2069301 RepID=A0ABS6JE88_9BACI|nr:hypothetical protein [Evansella tamaricis]MBU9711987.1 hypothetical protein [Evansella tamaricis]